jgi:hypothetical protein
MQKTTVYLPDDLKGAVERKARAEGLSEAQVIREAVAAATAAYRNPPKPRVGFVKSGDGHLAERVDELLAEGFGRW